MNAYSDSNLLAAANVLCILVFVLWELVWGKKKIVSRNTDCTELTDADSLYKLLI